ncbi:RmlC-like cupin domain-containing protein [Aspergillus heterothallicus]
MRLLVTGKLTDGAIALVSTGGSGGDPIGFHYHREAHDVFLCLKGNVNVWANDQAHTMRPGDFASVPPGVVHQYQILGDRSEFIGLIVPGGWEDFFRFLGEPYAGAMWPMNDERNPLEVLLPRVKEAAEGFDMVPQPHVKAFAPQAWENGRDNEFPGALQPYFLRAGTETAYHIGGAVLRALATTEESAGKCAFGSLEGSSFFGNQFLSSGLAFPGVHHAFHIVEGTFDFHIDGALVTLTAAEMLYVPKGSRFEVRFKSRFARAYVFASGGGLVELFVKAGEKHSSPIIAEAEGEVDTANVQQIGKEIGVTCG